ncbi:MAG: hydroxymethylglutaryl-CoA synthase [Flavobacteriaceae bacterium]|nr:MAG: hydroxymethylglutaryl-CoA synthase [Flavobacteriaceae bacterium]
MKVGIDAISYSIPKLQLPITDLASLRGLDPIKLEKGLGLYNMSIADVHQDVVTFAANAALKLIKEHRISPKELGRIYVASESGVDASKPIASYVLGMLEEVLKDEFGPDCLMHCDAVDFVFACISGVDALHNTLDWVRVRPDEMGLVICTDIAKYDLASTGEYTQGTGAVAMLIKENPRLIAFEKELGISTQSVFDFFKPRRVVSKKDIAGVEDTFSDWMGVMEDYVEIFKEQPVFEGQYSNQCYQERITHAFLQLKEKTQTSDLLESWQNIILHLPYAFQGRRMFGALYLKEILGGNPEKDPAWSDKVREVTKTKEYLDFVQQKLMPAELASSKVGNIYTGSIFLAFLSTLVYHRDHKNAIENKKFGFISYGSGSKSKVFQGVIAEGWREAIQNITLFEELENTKPISVELYEKLHRKAISQSVLPPKGEFYLSGIEEKSPNLIGARYYKYAAE